MALIVVAINATQPIWLANATPWFRILRLMRFIRVFRICRVRQRHPLPLCHNRPLPFPISCLAFSLLPICVLFLTPHCCIQSS